MEAGIYENETALQIMASAIRKNRLHHAYFIHGEPLTGKKTFGRMFAQAILCKGEDRPCGHCPSCARYQSGNHPDYVEIGAEQNGKNSFHADAVRAIKKDAYIKPNDGAYRVFLLCGIDSMTNTAANALLKILEEPPPSSVFLLTCSNRYAIPSTVYSRCVPVPMFSTSEEACRKALKERHPDISEERRQYAAQMANYNLGKALWILSDEQVERLSQLALQLLQAIAEKSQFGVLAALAPLEDNKPDAYSVLYFLEPLFMRAIRYKSGTAFMEDETPVLQKVSAAVTVKSLMELLQLVGAVREKLDQNANLRLALTWLSSSIGAIIRT